MSAPPRLTAVPRRLIAAGALAVVAAVAALVGAGEVLRHPEPPRTVAEEDLPGSDPRDELTCQEPREGQERDTDAGAPAETRPAIDVDSSQLYDCPQVYDGRRVIYRGEVIGGLLARDEGVWTQLNDDVYAELLGPLPAHRNYQGSNAGVGVLLPASLAASIEFVGGPQTRGDVLEIEGVFERVDPSGEVAVIHVDSGRIAASGEPFPDPVLTDRRIAAVIAILLAAAVVVVERRFARGR